MKLSYDTIHAKIITPFACLLAVTAGFVLFVSYYRGTLANQIGLEQQIAMHPTGNAISDKVIETEKNQEKNPHPRIKTPSAIDKNLPIKEKMKIAQSMPQTIEIKAYLKRLEVIEKAQANKKKAVEDYLKLVEEETPVESVRKLMETPLNRYFSRELTDPGYANPFAQTNEILLSLLEDPRIGKIYSILTDRNHPDYQDTLDALFAEGNEILEIESEAYIGAPHSALAVPYLLPLGSTSNETAILLNNIREHYYELKDVSIEEKRFTVTPMQKMITRGVSDFFSYLSADESAQATLSAGQLATLSEFNDYQEGRRENTRNIVFNLAAGESTSLDLEATQMSDGELDMAYERLAQHIPQPFNIFDGAGASINHDVYLYDLLERFLIPSTIN